MKEKNKRKPEEECRITSERRGAEDMPWKRLTKQLYKNSHCREKTPKAKTNILCHDNVFVRHCAGLDRCREHSQRVQTHFGRRQHKKT